MNIGRPREFDSEQALQSAMQVFWSKGYEATSLQDLINTMKISKSSFYQTFEGKHRLFQDCVQYYQDQALGRMTHSLEQAETGRAFIESVFKAMPDQATSSCDRRGCLVLNCASEFAQRDPAIAGLVKKSTRQITDVFLKAIKRAQQEGDISPNKKPLALARFLFSSLSGLTTMIKAGAGSTEVKQVTQLVLAALD